jgi:hypothetical protein
MEKQGLIKDESGKSSRSFTKTEKFYKNSKKRESKNERILEIIDEK